MNYIEIGLNMILFFVTPNSYMSYSLNSLMGGYMGDCIEGYYRACERSFLEFRL